MYQVRTDKFEGPMELLLELIQKEKLEITELSLSKVANEYLEYIKSNQNINLENLADFLSVASRLILIKSRALLPMLKFSEEEEEEIQDLAKQLEEYKKFKEVSINLGKIAGRGKICYSREGFGGVKSIFYPPEDFNIYDFKKHFLSILSEIPILEKLSEEIERNYLGTTSGYLRSKALKTAVRSNQRALESAEKGYQAGIRSTVDILNAQQTLFATRRDFLNSKLVMLQSYVGLYVLSGRMERIILMRIEQFY